MTTQIHRLLGWYLSLRLLVVCFFLGGTVIYQLRDTSWSASPIARYLVYLILLTVLFTVCSAFCLSRLKIPRRLFVNAQLTWDLLFVLSVIFLTGGVDSLYSFLFILVIIAASVFLPRHQLLVVASASSILYGSLLDLQYFGYLPKFGGQILDKDLQHYDVFYAVFLHVGAFFLTALLSGALAERLRRSEEARQQREIDYSELERLNQAILANINSGLMIINREGRIRSFNNAAMKITGYEFHEVYNRSAEIFFPEFCNINLTDFVTVERGETAFKNKPGEELILGYSAIHVRDTRGEDLGLLISFQDLTEYKTLEEQLQRADKLAAVGRLASGMAHEIRNPLASISGSVQLMMENNGASDEDRRLMGIVVREADRLNLLLSDFLNFARPSPLVTEPVDLSALIDELIDLLQASGQFGDVEIEKRSAKEEIMQVDRQKIRQALWDLLLNATEAASPGGRVTIALQTKMGKIIIEDSGAGISDEVRDKIFEPFYTTKDKGTGLGLANVYANIEAHGGSIFVEPSEMGGAKFIIELPVANGSA